jgi:acyl-CoA synthetase (NDP forming)/GNAT superfamily N-acetyltransferase
MTAIPPREWTVPPADVLMADGGIALIRPLRHDDRDGLLELHESVSVDTLRLRFFSVSRTAGRDYVNHLFEPANTGSTGLVALVGGRIAGLATAELMTSEAAEVAFLVSDDDRGRGLGSLLLEHLAALCRQHGVSRFEADVLADNYGMLRVFRGAGFAVSRRTVEGEVLVELDTDASREAVDAADRREWRAESRSLRPLLYPRSVAVVGVRRSGGGYGLALLQAIQASSFAGELHVVHPEAEGIDGADGIVPDRSLAALAERPIDLVVVAVPADRVADVVRDAAAAGAGAVLVVSSGVTAGGESDRAMLLTLARSLGVRLVGPDSQGALANDPGIGLNATFLTELPAAGGLAVASQSGGMGFALLDLARDIGLGVHAFVSLGDRIDVSSNDLLAAWMDDEGVTAAALYLESFGNALKFARTARRFAERKPLLAVVAGRSRARLLRTYDGAGADVSIGVDALLTQSGVIACRTGAELTETALLLAEQPLPQGLRVGIVVNTGGLGALAMDLVDDLGLGVVPLSAELQERLGRAVDARNPVDLGADVTPDELAATVGTLLGSGEVDAVLVLLVVTRLGDPAGLYAAVGKAREVAPDKPVLLVAPGAAAKAARGTPGVTVFRTIESATGALARTMRYAEWRRVPPDQPVVGIGTRGLHARAWANARLDARGGEPEWLPADGLRDLLGPYGIHRVGTVVADAGSAARVAAEIGFPVVVKVADPTEPHKADRGLVRVDVRDLDEIVSVIRGFAEELGQDQVDVLVQPLLLGHQVSVGVLRDPQLGSLVTVAAGGRATEGWDDEVALLPPVGPADAARAVRALRLWPQMLGGRGLQAVDVSALESLVVAVGQIAVDVPHLSDLTLEPVVLGAEGLHCVDVKARLVVPPLLDAGIPRRLRS